MRIREISTVELDIKLKFRQLPGFKRCNLTNTVQPGYKGESKMSTANHTDS